MLGTLETCPMWSTFPTCSIHKLGVARTLAMKSASQVATNAAEAPGRRWHHALAQAEGWLSSWKSNTFSPGFTSALSSDVVL